MVPSINSCTVAQARRNSFPPMSQWNGPRRPRRARKSCAIRKDSAKASDCGVCVPSELIERPKRRYVVVSSVKRKNNGWRSTTFPSGIQDISASTCSCICKKMSIRLPRKSGRRRSRECFQSSPSWVKIPCPRSGLNTCGRSPNPNAVSSQ